MIEASPLFVNIANAFPLLLSLIFLSCLSDDDATAADDTMSWRRT